MANVVIIEDIITSQLYFRPQYDISYLPQYHLPELPWLNSSAKTEFNRARRGGRSKRGKQKVEGIPFFA